MDPKCPFRGDKDDGDTEISCYEDHNYIKKIDGYQEAISKAFTYNECNIIHIKTMKIFHFILAYLCIHKPLSKEKENVSKGFLLNENHISSEILNKVYSLAGETNYVSNLASFFSNNRWLDIKGKVQITNYRVIFVPDDLGFLERISIRKDYFHFPMTFIEEIIFLNKKEWDFPVEFKFLMKDSRTFSLKIQPKPNFDFLKTYDYMISRSKIEDFRSFFAFSYHEYCKKGSDNHWELYDIKSEMKRQGIYDKITTGPNEKPLSLWNLIDNSDYSVCNTYPAFFVIPAKISKTQMMKCAEFRTKNRLPALVYVLKKHDPLTKKNKFVTLWRSSQIMVLFVLIYYSKNFCNKFLVIIRFS